MKTAFSFFIACISISSDYTQITDSSLRKINLENAVNFRDLGGYKTSNGKTVKWGVLYRSGEINRLNTADLALLKKKNIHTIIDFRGAEESRKAPDATWSNVEYIRCGAGSEGLTDWMQQLRTVRNGDSMMTAFYSNVDSLGFRYKILFHRLGSLQENDALLFHCTAGKDRTGIAASLILYLLGVPEETILQDYEASNYYRKSETEKNIRMMSAIGIHKDVAADLMSVKRSYLKATWDALSKKYGSIDEFLLEEFGISETQKQFIRSKLLD